MEQHKYQPTPDDMAKAEAMMNDAQKELSKVREDSLERGREEGKITGLPTVKREILETILAETSNGKIDFVKLSKMLLQENPELAGIVHAGTQMRDANGAALYSGLIVYYALKCQAEANLLKESL